MAEIKANLSEKDKNFREFALNGNMWRVVAEVSLPLMAYQGFMNLFKILDTIMASHISTDAVSSIAYISQISYLISAIGTGLSIGGGMKISEAYGAGDYVLVKKRVSTIYAICAAISALVLLMIPFAEFFLRLGGTTDSMISVGTKYFAVELGAITLNFFNSVYIAIERARGNSKLILRLNIVILVLKLGLTALFVYVLNGDVVTIAAATLISQAVFFLFALRNMSDRASPFGFSIHAISFRKNTALPMLKTSLPAAAERAAFAYGKLIVNSMCTVYGDSTVGALGVSNNIGGFSTSLQNGFQEGGASIISQNIGAGKHRRALDAFKKTLIINIGIGVLFTVIILFNLDFICGIFAGGDEEFRLLIKSVSRYEILGIITLGINAAVMALLYGYGYTKLTLLLNGARIFVFRVPVLWFLQNFTNLGSESAGVVMLVSNISVGVLAIVAAFFVVRRIKANYLANETEGAEK
ncbi:MAG: MATE family efflux transporter [Oscillospiraceae bacterium]